MTYDELMKTIEFVRERLAEQDWALQDYPQIDRAKIMRDINERLTRYRNMSDFSECRSANAEERSKDEHQ